MRLIIYTWRLYAEQMLLNWAQSRGHSIELIITTQGRKDVHLDCWYEMISKLPFELPALVSTKPKNFAFVVEKLAPDLIISFAYPHLIDQNSIRAARLGALNIHPGKLPEYRGPNAWRAIYNADHEITLSIHRLSDNFDSGEILSEIPIPIPNAITPKMMTSALSETIPLGLDAAIGALVSGKSGRQQDSSAHPKAEIFSEAEAILDWKLPIRQLLCRFTALRIAGMNIKAPLGNELRELREISPIETVKASGEAGRILSRLGNDAVIIAGDGIIQAEFLP